MIDDGGPAYPALPDFVNEEGNRNSSTIGMTLRNAFAIAALQGLIAKYGDGFQEHEKMTLHDSASISAYAFADAMLKERSKEPPHK